MEHFLVRAEASTVRGRRFSAFGAVVIGLVVVASAACGGATSAGSEGLTPATDGGAGGSSCEELSKAAAHDVQMAIDAHQACKTDTDCTSVAFSATCFDACTRVVATSGETAVSDAQNRVNGAQCRQFVAQGCKFDVPPCAPPSPPACKAGVCTN